MSDRAKVALGVIKSGAASNETILLVKEAYGHHFWTLPGGNVEPGESFTEAVIREIKEETGLETKVNGLVAVRERSDEIIMIFDMEICDGELLQSVPGEIEAIRWFDPDTLDDNQYPVYYFIEAIARQIFENLIPVLKIEEWHTPNRPIANFFVDSVRA
jgi:ADP-ribose pyrophosphatase YjhB (NUDIX family)